MSHPTTQTPDPCTPADAPRPRRVAIDYRPALFNTAGIARSVRELARSLADRSDVSLQLFGHAWRRPLPSSPIPARASLHRLRIPGRSMPWLRRLGWGADDLCGPGTRVFHQTDYVHPPVRSARIVLTIHDLLFADDQSYHGRRVAAGLLQRTCRAAARADVIAVPTHATATSVVQHLGQRTPVRVIPWGADHNPPRVEHKDANLPDRPFLLAVGTIEPRKNYSRLLRAWQAVPDEVRLPLVVLGRPGWQCDEDVAALRAATSSAIDLHWFDSAGDNLLGSALTHCHALLYPSLGEGFGFPPLEAMRAGRPVLTGTHPALAEVTGDAALQVDVRDEEALRDGIIRITGDETLRQQLTCSGTTRVARFTWAACAEAHAKLYTELDGR